MYTLLFHNQVIRSYFRQFLFSYSTTGKAMTDRCFCELSGKVDAGEPEKLFLRLQRTRFGVDELNLEKARCTLNHVRKMTHH